MLLRPGVLRYADELETVMVTLSFKIGHILHFFKPRLVEVIPWRGGFRRRPY